MRFRLVYDGPLPTARERRVEIKHAIRRSINHQIRELLLTHPALQFTDSDEDLREDDPTLFGLDRDTVLGTKPVKVGPFAFAPLVRKSQFATCHLDILFLRRAEAGSILYPGGDIDNRIKTVLDALRAPQQPSELKLDEVPKDNETPFWCLLEDDSLVTGFSVRTDRLLSLKRETEGDDFARIIIEVSIRVSKILWSNIPYLGD